MWYEDECELALEDEGIDPTDLAEDDEDAEWDGEPLYDIEQGFNPYEGCYDFDC